MNAPVSHRKHSLILWFFGLCALLYLVSPVHGQEAGQEIKADRYGFNGIDNLDHLMSSYQSQGLKINRLSTAWQSKSGTLTVGNTRSNFPNFLRGDPGSTSGYSPLFDDPHTSEQIAWAGRNGFSIGIEYPIGESDAVNAHIESLQGLTGETPSLILSWQGEFADQGRYKVSALGRKLDLKGVHDGVDVADKMLGWGLQMDGGWRFGDLFAALRVTLGNGIDSLILDRFGSDVAVSKSGEAETMESISILPSLNYSIDKRSDFHLSLGRYESRDDTPATGIDTLDTINLGYTWSPWPSARIGVEVTGKDFVGAISDEDSTEIKIGAEQRF